MADETEEKKGGKKKLIMIAVPVLLLAGAGAFFLMGGSDDAAAEEEPVVAEPVEGEVIDIGKMTVSLAELGPQGEQRYARVGLAVVLSTTADSATVGTRISLVQDAALTVISGMSPDELRTPEGMDKLRTAMTEKVLEIYPDGDVLRVVLTELIVQ